MSIRASLRFPTHGETEALHKDMWQQQCRSPVLEPMHGSSQPWSMGNVMDRPPSIARLAMGTDRSIGMDEGERRLVLLVTTATVFGWTMGVPFILRQNKTSSHQPQATWCQVHVLAL